MMLGAVLLFAAVQSVPSSGQPDPAVTTSRDYAECLGTAAVLNSTATPSIDDSVRRAFNSCQPKRAIALAAITSSFKTGGMDDARAAKEAQDFLRDRDQWMAEKLKADIAYHRKTGQIPPYAPNQ